MKKNETILITGGSGFIGSWLADALYQSGYTLIGIDLYVPQKPNQWKSYALASCESVDLDGLLKDINLTAVFHLAGGASVGSSVANPYSDFQSLLPATSRLALYLAAHHKSCRLFLFSSAAVYGNPKSLPISEDSDIEPISPYGIHKSLAEHLLANYSRIYGLQVTIFRIFSVFGPGLRKQLIWDVANRILAKKEENDKSLIMFGTGNESRDFIYIKDLCSIALLMLEKGSTSDYEVYNIGSGIETRVKTVVEYLVSKLDPNVQIAFNGEVRKGDPANWRSDIHKLKTLGFTTNYSVEDGLEEIVAWIHKI